MEDIRNHMKELSAEVELEEALDDSTLTSDERKVIEDQLRMIRQKYNDMVAELYA